MAWVLHDEADKAIVAEIAAQSDRGTMILAGSFLETRLMQAIILRLDPNATPSQLGKMFKGSGPLATFSSKIDVGLLLQVYPARIHEALHLVRSIRNDAAHETKPVSFSDQSTVDRCSNLHRKLGKLVAASFQHQQRFIALQVGAVYPGPPPADNVIADDGSAQPGGFTLAWHENDPPKQQFIATTQVLLFHLQAMKPFLTKARLELPPSTWPDKPD